jgi:hypothetical protein
VNDRNNTEMLVISISSGSQGRTKGHKKPLECFAEKHLNEACSFPDIKWNPQYEGEALDNES